MEEPVSRAELQEQLNKKLEAEIAFKKENALNRDKPANYSPLMQVGGSANDGAYNRQLLNADSKKPQPKGEVVPQVRGIAVDVKTAQSQSPAVPNDIDSLPVPKNENEQKELKSKTDFLLAYIRAVKESKDGKDGRKVGDFTPVKQFIIDNIQTMRSVGITIEDLHTELVTHKDRSIATKGAAQAIAGSAADAEKAFDLMVRAFGDMFKLNEQRLQQLKKDTEDIFSARDRIYTLAKENSEYKKTEEYKRLREKVFSGYDLIKNATGIDLALIRDKDQREEFNRNLTVEDVLLAQQLFYLAGKLS